MSKLKWLTPRALSMTAIVVLTLASPMLLGGLREIVRGTRGLASAIVDDINNPDITARVAGDTLVLEGAVADYHELVRGEAIARAYLGSEWRFGRGERPLLNLVTFKEEPKRYFSNYSWTLQWVRYEPQTGRIREPSSAAVLSDVVGYAVTSKEVQRVSGTGDHDQPVILSLSDPKLPWGSGTITIFSDVDEDISSTYASRIEYSVGGEIRSAANVRTNCSSYALLWTTPDTGNGGYALFANISRALSPSARMELVLDGAKE